MEHELIDYYQEQQISRQWLDFLRAFAEELGEQANEEELQFLMRSTGERLARMFEGQLPSIANLASLEDELNAYWRYMNWGYVRLEEADSNINITHLACPLASAFGKGSLRWTSGFLEGFYQAIFHSLGAGKRLHVRATDISSGADSLSFCFGLDQSIHAREHGNGH